MKKFKNIYLYLIGFIILVSLIGMIILFKNDDNFSFDNKNIRISNDNYNISINYPFFNKQKKINKEIEKYVKNEKKKFIKDIKNNPSKDNELNISYSYTIKDNIYSFHIRTYSIYGDNNNYYRSDKIYYFDMINNENISLDKLIINDNIYDFFKDNVRNYLISNNLYNEEILNNLEIKIVMFNENYIQLILESLKLSPFNREILININYRDIYKYLNKNYFTNNIKTYDEYVKNEIPQIRDKSLFKGKKLVALTFDDGPSYNKTQKLLDELDKRNARVSFFMLGEQAIKQPELVKNIFIKGHTIGSHTYDHKQLTKLKIDEVNYEVNYTNEIIKNITGEDVKYLRPPYGSYNEEMLENINMSFILWNVDVEDWKIKDENKIADYIVNNVDDGDIVLVHDIHDETIEGVIKAIDELQSKGFAFVSIDELINFKNIKIENHQAYRYFK